MAIEIISLTLAGIQVALIAFFVIIGRKHFRTVDPPKEYVELEIDPDQAWGTGN